jgi:hypothetical protein
MQDKFPSDDDVIAAAAEKAGLLETMAEVLRATDCNPLIAGGPVLTGIAKKPTRAVVHKLRAVFALRSDRAGRESACCEHHFGCIFGSQFLSSFSTARMRPMPAKWGLFCLYQIFNQGVDRAKSCTSLIISLKRGYRVRLMSGSRDGFRKPWNQHPR